MENKLLSWFIPLICCWYWHWNINKYDGSYIIGVRVVRAPQCPVHAVHNISTCIVTVSCRFRELVCGFEVTITLSTFWHWFYFVKSFALFESRNISPVIVSNDCRLVVCLWAWINLNCHNLKSNNWNTINSSTRHWFHFIYYITCAVCTIASLPTAAVELLCLAARFPLLEHVQVSTVSLALLSLMARLYYQLTDIDFTLFVKSLVSSVLFESLVWTTLELSWSLVVVVVSEGLLSLLLLSLAVVGLESLSVRLSWHASL